MSDLPPNEATDMSVKGETGVVDPQTQDLRAALRENDEKARKDSRNIPPLAWIVLLALIALGVFAWMQYGGSVRTPHGGTAPVEAADTARAAPAST